MKSRSLDDYAMLFDLKLRNKKSYYPHFMILYLFLINSKAQTKTNVILISKSKVKSTFLVKLH